MDPEGKPLNGRMLKPDMPVKYTYVKEGDRMVVTQSHADRSRCPITKREDDHDDDDSALTSRSLVYEEIEAPAERVSAGVSCLCWRKRSLAT